MTKLCIGLFGTCADSRWRDPFVAAYQARGIAFFNPQVDNWHPAMAAHEAEHLAHDQIVLFPITAESYGLGSLAETGFAALSASQGHARRDVVVMIEPHLQDRLQANAELYQHSLNTRALVAAHLSQLRHDNVFVVDDLQQMLELSLQLYAAAETRHGLRQFNPSERA